MNHEIYFDMDGTIADLYGVENWLEKLIASDSSPYAVARELVNANLLTQKLHKLQKMGWKIGIISWLSKNSTPEYDEKVKEAKMNWLHEHFRNFTFDAIHILPYGINKSTVCDGGILFDDEIRNRHEWKNGVAFEPQKIMKVLGDLTE